MAALLFAGSTFAQGTSSKSEEAVKEEAMQKTNDLDAIVNLTEEQRSQVLKVFVSVQHQEASLETQMANNPEGRIDQDFINKTTQGQVMNDMVKVLTAEQYDTYKLSLKKQ